MPGDWTFFVFRETFNLTGYDPSTASLQFQWAADDSGQGFADRGTWVPKYSLNGGPLITGTWPGGDTYGFGPTVDISSGFVPGLNVIEFYVEGNGATDGMALDPLSFTANAVPEPASLTLLGIALASGLARAWRRASLRPADSRWQQTSSPELAFRFLIARRGSVVDLRMSPSSCLSKASYNIMGRTGSLRSDNAAYCDFLTPHARSELGDGHERIAESLLLTWLAHADPNILGLRRVDESTRGHRLAMVHIAIPLHYKRAQLAQALGIDQLADEKKTPRVNLTASAAWNEPHSYIRIEADFIASRVLRAIKEQFMRSSDASGHTIQIPLDHAQTLAHSRPEERDENSRLRSSVRRAMA